MTDDIFIYENGTHWAAPTAEAYARTCKALNRLQEQLNTPELFDFSKAVIAEAQHQRHRWGTDHDSGKEPQDWFWLLGY